VAYALVTMMPLAWIFITAFKSGPDSIAYPPKIVFTPSAEGFCNLFTTRTRQTAGVHRDLPPAASTCDRVSRANNMVIAGPSNYVPRFINSLVIAFGSTALSVLLGRHRRLRVLAPARAAEGRPAVLHPVDPHDAADRGGRSRST
jgi:multiple sugar transport system permease protein